MDATLIAPIVTNGSLGAIFMLMWWFERRDRVARDDLAKRIAEIAEDAVGAQKTMIDALDRSARVSAELRDAIEDLPCRRCGSTGE